MSVVEFEGGVDDIDALVLPAATHGLGRGPGGCAGGGVGRIERSLRLLSTVV